ncbi:MAG: hypothetical protein NT033_05525 [Candidatus Omnitrophica bacterium]|nr:hypothetical protein [Candidatus Omnitrophota bacterium]
MRQTLEKIVSLVYKKWEKSHPASSESHPDEEALASFLDRKLDIHEHEVTLRHLVSCQECLQKIALNVRSGMLQETDVPPELIRRAKNIMPQASDIQPLEIVLRVKGNLLELIKTTGDVLFGQELLPAPVLRSRQIKDFKDEVTVLKDFAGMRVEIKVENKADSSFNATVSVKDKKTGLPIKDFRVTLMRDETELESYLAKTGTVIFEHISLGRYAIEIANLQEKLASVKIDIKK